MKLELLSLVKTSMALAAGATTTGQIPVTAGINYLAYYITGKALSSAGAVVRTGVILNWQGHYDLMPDYVSLDLFAGDGKQPYIIRPEPWGIPGNSTINVKIQNLDSTALDRFEIQLHCQRLA
jgi:hypothetical protein